MANPDIVKEESAEPSFSTATSSGRSSSATTRSSRYDQFQMKQKSSKRHRITSRFGRERSFTCAECAKSFTQRGSLVQHMKIHTGEKPHECRVCHKSFGCKSNMTRHLRIHTGEKPYKCAVCGWAFNQSGTLKVHMLKSHYGRKGKGMSGKKRTSTKRNENTARHITIGNSVVKEEKKSTMTIDSTRRKPCSYPCSYCNVSDEAKPNSEDQEKRGSIEIYTCNVCGQTFDRMIYIKKHMWSHIDVIVEKNK